MYRHARRQRNWVLASALDGVQNALDVGEILGPLACDDGFRVCADMKTTGKNEYVDDYLNHMNNNDITVVHALNSPCNPYRNVIPEMNLARHAGTCAKAENMKLGTARDLQGNEVVCAFLGEFMESGGSTHTNVFDAFQEKIHDLAPNNPLKCVCANVNGEAPTCHSSFMYFYTFDYRDNTQCDDGREHTLVQIQHGIHHSPASERPSFKCLPMTSPCRSEGRTSNRKEPFPSPFESDDGICFQYYKNTSLFTDENWFEWMTHYSRFTDPATGHYSAIWVYKNEACDIGNGKWVLKDAGHQGCTSGRRRMEEIEIGHHHNNLTTSKDIVVTSPLPSNNVRVNLGEKQTMWADAFKMALNGIRLRENLVHHRKRRRLSTVQRQAREIAPFQSELRDVTPMISKTIETLTGKNFVLPSIPGDWSTEALHGLNSQGGSIQGSRGGSDGRRMQEEDGAALEDTFEDTLEDTVIVTRAAQTSLPEIDLPDIQSQAPVADTIDDVRQPCLLMNRYGYSTNRIMQSILGFNRGQFMGRDVALRPSTDDIRCTRVSRDSYKTHRITPLVFQSGVFEAPDRASIKGIIDRWRQAPGQPLNQETTRRYLCGEFVEDCTFDVEFGEIEDSDSDTDGILKEYRIVNHRHAPNEKKQELLEKGIRLAKRGYATQRRLIMENFVSTIAAAGQYCSVMGKTQESLDYLSYHQLAYETNSTQCDIDGAWGEFGGSLVLNLADAREGQIRVISVVPADTLVDIIENITTNATSGRRRLSENEVPPPPPPSPSAPSSDALDPGVSKEETQDVTKKLIALTDEDTMQKREIYRTMNLLTLLLRQTSTNRRGPNLAELLKSRQNIAGNAEAQNDLKEVRKQVIAQQVGEEGALAVVADGPDVTGIPPYHISASSGDGPASFSVQETIDGSEAAKTAMKDAKESFKKKALQNPTQRTSVSGGPRFRFTTGLLTKVPGGFRIPRLRKQKLFAAEAPINPVLSSDTSFDPFPSTRAASVSDNVVVDGQLANPATSTEFVDGKPLSSQYSPIDEFYKFIQSMGDDITDVTDNFLKVASQYITDGEWFMDDVDRGTAEGANTKHLETFTPVEPTSENGAFRPNDPVPPSAPTLDSVVEDPDRGDLLDGANRRNRNNGARIAEAIVVEQTVIENRKIAVTTKSKAFSHLSYPSDYYSEAAYTPPPTKSILKKTSGGVSRTMAHLRKERFRSILPSVGVEVTRRLGIRDIHIWKNTMGNVLDIKRQGTWNEFKLSPKAGVRFATKHALPFGWKSITGIESIDRHFQSEVKRFRKLRKKFQARAAVSKPRLAFSKKGYWSPKLDTTFTGAFAVADSYSFNPEFEFTNYERVVESVKQIQDRIKTQGKRRWKQFASTRAGKFAMKTAGIAKRGRGSAQMTTFFLLEEVWLGQILSGFLPSQESGIDQVIPAGYPCRHMCGLQTTMNDIGGNMVLSVTSYTMFGLDLTLSVIQEFFPDNVANLMKWTSGAVKVDDAMTNGLATKGFLKRTFSGTLKNMKAIKNSKVSQMAVSSSMKGAALAMKAINGVLVVVSAVMLAMEIAVYAANFKSVVSRGYGPEVTLLVLEAVNMVLNAVMILITLYALAWGLQAIPVIGQLIGLIIIALTVFIMFWKEFTKPNQCEYISDDLQSFCEACSPCLIELTYNENCEVADSVYRRTVIQTSYLNPEKDSFANTVRDNLCSRLSGANGYDLLNQYLEENKDNDDIQDHPLCSLYDKTEYVRTRYVTSFHRLKWSGVDNSDGTRGESGWPDLKSSDCTPPTAGRMLQGPGGNVGGEDGQYSTTGGDHYTHGVHEINQRYNYAVNYVCPADGVCSDGGPGSQKAPGAFPLVA